MTAAGRGPLQRRTSIRGLGADDAIAFCAVRRGRIAIIQDRPHLGASKVKASKV
jgi:hypothetical protein